MNPTVKKLLGESAEVPQVIESTKPVKIYLCPGCNQEIFEKHSYVDESGVDHHSDCGAAFKWPPPSPEQQKWLDSLLNTVNPAT